MVRNQRRSTTRGDWVMELGCGEGAWFCIAGAVQVLQSDEKNMAVNPISLLFVLWYMQTYILLFLLSLSFFTKHSRPRAGNKKWGGSDFSRRMDAPAVTQLSEWRRRLTQGNLASEYSELTLRLYFKICNHIKKTSLFSGNRFIKGGQLLSQIARFKKSSL